MRRPPRDRLEVELGGQKQTANQPGGAAEGLDEGTALITPDRANRHPLAQPRRRHCG